MWCLAPTGGSSSASSSDDEVKEAFESCLPSPLDHNPDHTFLSPVQRPIRVAPSGCRKRVPKYFAQMASAECVERPRLDFNKMQSKRLVMVRLFQCVVNDCHCISPSSAAQTCCITSQLLQSSAFCFTSKCVEMSILFCLLTCSLYIASISGAAS